MRLRLLLTGGVLFAVVAATASDQDSHGGLAAATATTVSGVTGTITAQNFGESGATVNGLLVGTNVLLTFSKQVCGGIGSLGKATDNVTYSGVAVSFASGFQLVHVTSFTNGSITYPPPAPPKPAAYPLTAGTIAQLNYSEVGTVNGFLFTPASGPQVFVDIGPPNSTLAPLLTKGAAISVTGMLEPPPPCSPSGTISEVDASSLTIGTTAYPIHGTGMGMGFAFGHLR